MGSRTSVIRTITKREAKERSGENWNEDDWNKASNGAAKMPEKIWIRFLQIKQIESEKKQHVAKEDFLNALRLKTKVGIIRAEAKMQESRVSGGKQVVASLADQIAILRLQEKLYLTLAEENYSEANDTLKQLVAKKMNDPSNTETDFTETKINVPLISDAMNEKHLESVLDKYSNACIDAYNKGNTAVAETLRTQVARKQSALARLKRHNAIIKMRSSHTKFTRPTPKPIRTFRSAYARWTLPGVNKRIEDGFPTRAEIARDCRDYALGIGNGYGTGKTELALAGAEATRRNNQKIEVSYISFSNGFTFTTTECKATLENPQKYVGLWLFAAKQSTKFDAHGNVVANSQLFKNICSTSIQKDWTLPVPSKQVCENRIVIVDEVQALKGRRLLEFLECLVTYNTRMTVVVGAVSFYFVGKSENRLTDVLYPGLNLQDMTDIFEKCYGPLVKKNFEGIHLPRVYGGLVRALVNTSTKTLTDNNNPLAVIEDDITKLYDGTETPAFLLRAVFADVHCLRKRVVEMLKKSDNMSIGALQVKDATAKRFKFTVPPVLVSSGCLKLPDVVDPQTYNKFIGVMKGMANPSWSKFESLTCVASALRLAALLQTTNQLWDDLETVPLQMVFGSKHCTSVANELLGRIRLRENPKVHWYHGGTKHFVQDDKRFVDIKALVDKNNIVVVTLDCITSPTCPPFDNYLALPTGMDGDILLVAIEAKHTDGSDYLNLKTHIKPKMNRVREEDWLPKWDTLFVFTTNRLITTRMSENLEESDLSDFPVICSNDLEKLMGCDFVPLKYRQ